MLHFAHGCGAMAAELRAASDAMEAGASPNAAREARRALGVAQERLAGEESKERAHGNPPFLSAAPRSRLAGGLGWAAMVTNVGVRRRIAPTSRGRPLLP